MPGLESPSEPLSHVSSLEFDIDLHVITLTMNNYILTVLILHRELLRTNKDCALSVKLQYLGLWGSPETWHVRRTYLFQPQLSTQQQVAYWFLSRDLRTQFQHTRDQIAVQMRPRFCAAQFWAWEKFVSQDFCMSAKSAQKVRRRCLNL